MTSKICRQRSRCGLYAGSAVLTRTRHMTSLNVGLSGSGSCGEHERRWSSNSLISLAPKSGVVMSGFSQLAHVTTNTCHRRSDMADAPGLRRLCADQTQIRRRADTERFCGTAEGEVVFALVGHASGASYARSTAATRTRGHHLAQHRRVPERLGCRAGAEVVHNELDLW